MFPADLITLERPVGSQNRTGHADLHVLTAEIVEALMAKVGIDSSTNTASIDYLLKNPLSVSPGHKHAIADINLINETFVHKTGDETIAGVKTFSDVVNINGPFQLNDTAGERLSEIKFHTKNQANNGGVDWKLFADADFAATGNRQWSLWGYPLKNSDGSIGGYERFITASFPTYDGNTTYTKLVEINANLNTGNIVGTGIQITGGSPGVGKVLTSDASGNATWQTPSGNATLARSLTAIASASGTTTETTMATLNVPAGSLGTNRMLKLSMQGQYNQTGGAVVTLTVRVKFGTTTVCTFDFVSSTVSDSYVMTSEVYILANGATNSQIGKGVMNLNFNSNTPNTKYDFGRRSENLTMTEDSTVSKDITVTTQMNSTSAGNTMTFTAFVLELL